MSFPGINRSNRRQTALVRPMVAHDVPRVVEIHQAAFENFFLTFLGARFLRLLYGEAVRLDEIALVAEMDGEVMALVMGSAHPGAFYKKLIKRRLFAFGSAAVPAVLRQPSVAMRVGRAVLTPRTAAKLSGTATLMSLAVAPSARDAGPAAAWSVASSTRRDAAAHRWLPWPRTATTTTAPTSSMSMRASAWRRQTTTSEGRALNEYELDL